MYILYSNDCPNCKILENKLKNKNVEFKKESNLEYIIEQGLMSVPILRKDDILMTFMDANEYLNKLERVTD